MTKENVVKQLKDLKSEAEYNLRYEPDNDVWIDDYNALEVAIKAVENKKDNLGFWVGFILVTNIFSISLIIRKFNIERGGEYGIG